MYLNIFLLTLIIVFIIDWSGAIQHLVHPIVKKLLGIPKTSTIKIPLIECSCCCSFWCGLIYLIIINQFTFLPIAYVCLCSFLTKPILGVYNYIQNVLIYIENVLYELIDPK